MELKQTSTAVISGVLRSNDRVHNFWQLNRKSPEEDRYSKQIKRDKENNIEFNNRIWYNLHELKSLEYKEAIMEKYLEMLKKGELTREEFLPVWEEFKKDLNNGKVRVASKEGT